MCLILLVVGWFGIPYYVGQQVKDAVSKAGFAPGVVVEPSYWLQKVKVSNITITPTTSPVVKKIYIPELTLDYNAASLFSRKASIIEIPTVEMIVLQPISEFVTEPHDGHGIDAAKIEALVKMLPKQKLIVKNLIIKNENAANIKVDNIFKVQIDLKPTLLTKDHYKVKIVLDGQNPLILIRDTIIKGSAIHAILQGKLLLEKEIKFNGNVKLTAGSITLPNANLYFEHGSANGSVIYNHNALAIKGKYQTKHFHILNIAFIQDPLKIEGDFTITSNAVHVSLQGNDKAGFISGNGSIDNNVLNLNATSVDFVSQRLNLQSIFATLTQPIIFSQGIININGIIGLSSKVNTSLHVIGTNLAGTVNTSTFFTGLNSNIEIINFKPFTTADNQPLSITKFNPGLPFKNVVLTYQLLPDESKTVIFHIRTSSAQFAGGTLTSNGFLYNPNDANHSALLTAKNINVGKILQYTKVKGLSGTGTLTGELLFQWGADGLQIKSGNLHGTGGDSKITYIPGQKAGKMKEQSAQLSLAMNALKNFHYKNFQVVISSNGNETHLVAHLTGFNPDLYDGLPVALNFTLTGELNLILDTILIGKQLKRHIIDVSSVSH